jgi:hypothetical protein
MEKTNGQFDVELENAQEVRGHAKKNRYSPPPQVMKSFR